MKVNITNKKLWLKFNKYISITAGIISFLFAFIDLNQCIRMFIGIIYFCALFILFFVMWYDANHKNSKKMYINGTDVKIFYGDIFNQDGIKVIAFNEFFDTQVDDRIISVSSLNGQYILHHSDGKEYIDSVIKNEKHLHENVVQKKIIRKNGGKQVKYRLGTICPVKDYFLLALTHFDENDRAFLTLEDYISCLMHMWTELDILYAGMPINITLLGSGITRFNNGVVSEQELLRYIVETFKISKVQFGNTSSLSIVLNDSVKEKINLYNIGKEE